MHAYPYALPTLFIKRLNIVATRYKNEKIDLSDGVDVGYEVEKIKLSLEGDGEYVVPTRGVTTLLVCAPFFDDSTISQLKELDEEFFLRQAEGFEALIVLSSSQKPLDGFKFFRFAADDSDEFGAEFGVKIDGGALAGGFAKALFTVSRDYMLFYKEICKNIEDDFSIDKLYFQLGKALNVYNGMGGCH